VLVAALAALTHVAWIAWRISHDHWFITDDDPYRLYHGHLAAAGAPTVFSSLWPPGHGFAIALLERVGIPLAVTGIVIGVAATAISVGALAAIARRLDDRTRRDETPRAAILVALATPWFLHVSYGGLAEPLAMALASFAAACALARIDGAPRSALFAGALALLLATWVRYETWCFVPFFAIGVPLAHHPASPARSARVVDAFLAAIPCLGPIAWLVGERLTFGDAFVFVRVNHEISSQVVGHADRLAVAWHRLRDLAIESPAALVLGIIALGGSRSRRARVLVAASLVPLLAQVIDGHEQTVYPARLVAPLVFASIPLAATSLVRMRMPLAVTLVVVPLTIVPFTQPSLLDESSVAFGSRLRSHRYDVDLAGGALLIEREARRPPFGWASVGVLWAHWPRTVFGTHAGRRWEFSEPSDVRAGRVFVDDAALSSWLARRGVRGAWVLTPGARASVTAAWGGAHAQAVGDGVFVTPASPSRSVPAALERSP
jgi:hypothetical protein